MNYINYITDKMYKDNDIRYTKEELQLFINKLNFNIQYLGLRKDEVIKIVDKLYK